MIQLLFIVATLISPCLSCTTFAIRFGKDDARFQCLLDGMNYGIWGGEFSICNYCTSIQGTSTECDIVTPGGHCLQSVAVSTNVSSATSFRNEFGNCFHLEGDYNEYAYFAWETIIKNKPLNVPLFDPNEIVQFSTQCTNMITLHLFTVKTT